VAIPADPSTAGKAFACPGCGREDRLVWAKGQDGSRLLVKLSGLRAAPGTFLVACDCGQPVIARREHAGKILACPICKASLPLERAKDPQTLETKIRRRPASTSTMTAAAQPGEDVVCLCGQSLRISREHLGREAMCPHCGAKYHLEAARDAQTGMTRVLPRFKGQGAPPTPPSDAWSLDDFA
jgi:DNA-directed RNA polymerase subunit M/transcription elongation factor TFIIS